MSARCLFRKPAPQLAGGRSLATQQEVIRAEVLIGVSSVQEARRRVESQRQTVAAAALGYRITHNRWRAGIALT